MAYVLDPKVLEEIVRNVVAEKLDVQDSMSVIKISGPKTSLENQWTSL